MVDRTLWLATAILTRQCLWRGPRDGGGEAELLPSQPVLSLSVIDRRVIGTLAGAIAGGFIGH